MAKGDDIQERLIDFAVGIVKQSSALPKTKAGNHIAGQLLRCGTSPAPNYGEARGAESTNDFIHKLGIVLKELNESGIWLEIIKRSEMLALEVLQPLMQECTELAKIISSSIRTASSSRSIPKRE
ncbi:MAG: four helix bundle protein [candidate division KSB1 bacterium]|nr:four helix bundle protein [candidate division KSB1 bacterium]MDZ7368379.1 four helix bundle protein [candidate division KSB1 bacterium]MDZ7406045.1 four helix bundle protein [candidate division KSB1 bacterium]